MGEAAAAASHEAPRRDGRCMKRRRRPPSVNQTVGSAIGDVRYTANLQQNLANTLNNPSRPWFRSKPSAICTPSRPAAGGSPVSPSVAVYSVNSANLWRSQPPRGWRGYSRHVSRAPWYTFLRSRGYRHETPRPWTVVARSRMLAELAIEDYRRHHPKSEHGR